MRVAVIGGGFTGLAAAVELVDKRCEVSVFEEGVKLGGLANSFEVKGWKWPLEKYYHHAFFNDKELIEMSNKVGGGIFFREPVTKAFINGESEQLDTPYSLLTFKGLSFFARLRTGAGLAFLKLVMTPKIGVLFEKFSVVKLLPVLVGREAFVKVWEPLLIAKFGKYTDKVNMAWYWARIFKRTKKLGYFKGGYQNLGERMGKYISRKGGKVFVKCKIKEIRKGKDGKLLIQGEEFDKVIVTTPLPVVNSLFGEEVVKKGNTDYLYSQTLILEMKESLMDGYWLNILERDWPFLVVVEHTNFVEKRNYGGKRVLYLGNYLAPDDKRLSMSDRELFNLFCEYLKKINPSFKKGWVSRKWRFQSPFAQPVFEVNYSKKIPDLRTKVAGAFIANMSMVYPWDRGTNYAIEIGRKVARLVVES